MIAVTTLLNSFCSVVTEVVVQVGGEATRKTGNIKPGRNWGSTYNNQLRL